MNSIGWPLNPGLLGLVCLTNMLELLFSSFLATVNIALGKCGYLHKLNDRVSKQPPLPELRKEVAEPRLCVAAVLVAGGAPR